jgi:hypothetical protein
MKGVLKYAAAFAVVALVGWLGGYLYWHIRLIGAIHTLEARTGPAGTDQDAADVIHDAGCRALPYLIGAIQSTKNPSFFYFATSQLKESLHGPISRGDKELAERLAAWAVNAEESAAARQQRGDEIQAWWRQNGEPRHSTWRWWTGDCGGM